MATATGAPGSLKLTIVAQKPTAGTQTYAVTATDYFGQRVDQSGIVFYPATGVTNNGDGTYTIARAANGAGDTTYSPVASAPGYNSVTGTIVVPQQGAVILAPPALSVTPTQNAGNVSFAYTATGTLTWLKDTVSQGTPGGPPLVVSRDAAGGADHTVNFHCVGADGTIIDLYFTVPVQPTASGGTVTTTAATQTTPWGFSTAAQANGIVTLLNNIHDALVAKGIIT